MSPFNSFFRLFVGLIGLFYLFPSPVLGYFIDESCNQIGEEENIVRAAEEAKNMAAYAVFRSGRHLTPGEIRVTKTLLGNNGRNLLTDRMGLIQNGVRNHSPAIDDTVLIKCGDQHFTYLNQAPTGGRWKDPDFQYVNMLSPGTSPVIRPCQVAGRQIAFTYGTNSDHPDPSHVIVLCTGSAPAALGHGLPRYFGNTWGPANDWFDTKFDWFAQYTSTTLLHEFMHVVGLPATLPGGHDEVYQYDAIAVLPDNDKENNAEGYSMWGTAFWLGQYHGISQGSMGPRLAENRRPIQPPQSPHFPLAPEYN